MQKNSTVELGDRRVSMGLQTQEQLIDVKVTCLTRASKPIIRHDPSKQKEVSQVHSNTTNSQKPQDRLKKAGTKRERPKDDDTPGFDEAKQPCHRTTSNTNEDFVLSVPAPMKLLAWKTHGLRNPRAVHNLQDLL